MARGRSRVRPKGGSGECGEEPGNNPNSNTLVAKTQAEVLEMLNKAIDMAKDPANTQQITINALSMPELVLGGTDYVQLKAAMEEAARINKTAGRQKIQLKSPSVRPVGRASILKEVWISLLTGSREITDPHTGAKVGLPPKVKKPTASTRAGEEESVLYFPGTLKLTELVELADIQEI